MVSRVLNLLALGFTIVFSALLLLCVRWNAFHEQCIQEDTCDISEVPSSPLLCPQPATHWQFCSLSALCLLLLL